MAVVQNLFPEPSKEEPKRLTGSVQQINLTAATQPGSMDAFREWVGKIAQDEAKKQISRYITVNQQQQNETAFLASMNDEFTIATDPNGVEYSAIVIGNPVTKYLPFFKITGDRGVAYTTSAPLLNIDGGQKVGHVLIQEGRTVSVRLLGGDLLAPLIEAPAYVTESNIQALFSADRKNIMVGWWWKDTTAPYFSHATYVIFKNYSLSEANDTIAFGYESTESNTFNLNDYANGVVPPPAFNTPQAFYIWFNHPGDGEGDFVRFFPIVSGFYNTLTNTYEYTYHPEWPASFTRVTMDQEGNYNANWYLDTNTLADFTSCRFAFNNKTDGSIQLDIVTSFRALTVGMMLEQTLFDQQHINLFSSLTDFLGIFQGTVEKDTIFQTYRKDSWLYTYDYNFIGEDFDWEYTTTSLPADNWAFMSRGFYDQKGNGTPYGLPTFSDSGTDKVYNNIVVDGFYGPQFQEELTGSPTLLTDTWYSQYVGTSPAIPILYPPDESTYLITTYEGVQKPTSFVGNPTGDVIAPEVFAYQRLMNFLAGLFSYEFFHYTLIPQGPFARDYYFAKITMVIEDALNGGVVKFNSGEPPLTARDFNTIITPYRGINETTALCYRQEQYPTDTVYVDPDDDVSFQALIQILRESGLDALADYLELQGGPGTVTIQSKQVYWFTGSYYNYPLYGYDNNYDVITDAVVAPGGTFPFAGQLFKGLDSYIIIGYNGSDGTNESISIYSVAANGETSIQSRSRKRKISSTGTVLDIGMKYGS